MTIEVVFAPEAENDLIALRDSIADSTSADRALTYAERTRLYYLNFATFPQRGTSRGDMRAGLRTIGFELRVTIAMRRILAHRDLRTMRGYVQRAGLVTESPAGTLDL